MPLEDLVKEQIALLRAGDVMGAFERYFHDDVLMMQDGDHFADSKAEGRAKQKNFFASIRNFQVEVHGHRIVGDASLLEVSYAFTNERGEAIRFDGIHLHEWENGQIIREQFATEGHIPELLDQFAVEE